MDLMLCLVGHQKKQRSDAVHYINCKSCTAVRKKSLVIFQRFENMLIGLQQDFTILHSIFLNWINLFHENF